MKHDKTTIAIILVLLWIMGCIMFFSGCTSRTNWIDENWWRNECGDIRQRMSFPMNNIPVLQERIAHPYKIRQIPTTQYEWMCWNVMNIKLNKNLMR